MNRVEIYIIVEGQSEQTFVRDVLAPHMANKGTYLHPSLIGKPGHKGGDIHFDRAKNDIGNFLKQRKDTYVSTMFDYFRIDSKWPGRDKIRRRIRNGVSLAAIQKADILEAATHREIVKIFADHNAENRFIPYIEMYEFEALLFSDADILAEKTEIEVSRIREILERFNNNPEEIDDDPENAPSKRIKSLANGYRKVAGGKIISEAIGIRTIRRQCPHFNNWLTRLEHIQL
ncbi:MAG: DUF4276 family protein [Deltaproteobacteria bacterium]|nr:DUF4276 family protein [Deltaproteobacteria bacterium]